MCVLSVKIISIGVDAFSSMSYIGDNETVPTHRITLVFTIWERGPDVEGYTFLFPTIYQTKPNGVGTQNTHLNETIILSTYIIGL